MFNTKEHKFESVQPYVQLKLFKLDSKEKINFSHTYILEEEFLNLNKYLVLMKYLDVNQEDRQKRHKKFAKHRLKCYLMRCPDNCSRGKLPLG